MKKTPFANLAASNHSTSKRAMHDYYATDERCVMDLMEREELTHEIVEPSVGAGHIANCLAREHCVVGIDIVDRGWKGTIVKDFLDYDEPIYCDVVMNPPYTDADKHVKHALDLIDEGRKVCAFLKVQFLESEKRKYLFEQYKPQRIYVYRKRVKCGINGDFEAVSSSAVMYCWFIWVKGQEQDPIIKWID